jgi:hypothetical protein
MPAPSHGPIGTDILYIQHTDGDVRSFMDLFCEAGIDALQPLEAKANMDVRELDGEPSASI